MTLNKLSNYPKNANKSLDTEVLINETEIVDSVNYDYIINDIDRYALQFVYDNETPAGVDFDADTEVNITTDTITKSSHGLTEGLVGQLTSTDTLPAGLATSTDYYIKYIDDDNFQLSLTDGGDAVDITDVGTVVKEITSIGTVADASAKEITAVTAVADASVQEITDITAVASNTPVKEITDIATIAEGSTKEITDITAVAESSVKEITSIATVADVGGNLNQTYFIMSDNAGTVAFWYDVDDSGSTEPAHGATRGVEITTVTTGMTAAQVGDATYTAVLADSEFEAGTNDNNGNLTIQSATYGVKLNSNAGTTGFTVGENTPGVNPNYDGTYFVLQDDSGTVAFWFDVDDSGTAEPSHGAARSIEITTVTTGMTAGQAGTAIYNAIIADSKFEAGSDDTNGNLTIQNTDYAPKTAQSAGTSPLTVGENTSGAISSLDGKYFTIYDASGSVGVWFDVDDSGTSAPAGALSKDRQIEITTVTSEMTAGQVGTVLYTALVADAAFEAGSDDTNGNLTIQDADYGVRTNAADGDTGFTIGENTAGVDSNYDGKYFILEDNAGTVAFWFDVYGGTSEPSHGANRSVEISTVTVTMALGATGTAIYNAIIGDSKFEAGSDDTNGNLTIKNTEYGARTLQDAGTSALVIAENTSGVDSVLDGKYFLLEDAAGTVAVWFNISGSTSEPSHGANRAIEISTISYADVIGTVGDEIYTTVVADSKFEAGTNDAGGNLTIQNSEYGARTLQDAGTSTLTVVQDTTGVDSNLDGKYFTLQDDDGSVAFWIDLNDSGTSEPSHGADRSIEITTLTSAMTAGQVGTAIYTAIIADSKFEAGSDDTNGNITVQNTEAGVRIDAADGDTGFTITEDTAGASATHTFTATALSGGSITVKKSNDGENWVNVESATNITASGSHFVEASNIAYPYIRLAIAITTGRISFKAIIS